MVRPARCLLAGFMAFTLCLIPAREVSAVPLTPTADILIDAGHGGIDGGTSHGDVLEKDINLAVAKKLGRLLAEEGYRVAYTRYADYALSDDNRWLRIRSRHLKDLAQRSYIAEGLQPELLISLHVNWSRKPYRSGPLVLHRSKHAPSFMLASVIQHSLNRLYGTNAAPYGSDAFYILNGAPCPAVIIEMGFISNPSDRELLTASEGQEKLAEAVLSAIREYMFLLHIKK